MAKPTASPCVVARDILVAFLDIAGDWTYFVFLYFFEHAVRHHAQYNILIYCLFTFSVFGSILSLWVIATSFGRTYRYKSLCCKCTVPRLAMSLILLHHVPQFILTSYIDLSFNGEMTWAGWVNIGTSMLALINTLGITKCGEGYCWSSGGGKVDQDMEMGNTLTGTEGESTSDYKNMAAVV